MEIRTIEIAGFASALTALRLPYGKETRSQVSTALPYADAIYAFDHVGYGTDVYVNEQDLTLMQTLVRRGDEHAKPMRGILAYADIVAPIHFWVEMETYIAGRQRLFSGSTMHTEGRGLSGHTLDEAIKNVPYDRPVRKVDFFSYQCLRNIVYQRHDHRKVEWHWFIEWIKTLPLAKELILVGLEDKIAVHDEYMRKYNANEI